jgi:hypothetical protein
MLTLFLLQTLIAIKAPSGTTLAVPYPDESVPPNRRKYQIFLKSKDGPVDIYLVNSPRVSSHSPTMFIFCCATSWHFLLGPKASLPILVTGC